MSRRAATSRKNTNKRFRDRANKFMGNTIFVTDHAISRYQERVKQVKKGNAVRNIVEGVKRSRMIALTKYGGREIRENKGMLFVCELEGNVLNVITVLISEVDLRFAC